ncbi:lytic murein transglycosylase [Pseudaestuariivita sp.]|uniref:lytic murein transglycosylase n=1 Tax=Pseudaestuariivita sp. TaxID=2211669 RepID=UPI00405A1A26
MALLLVSGLGSPALAETPVVTLASAAPIQSVRPETRPSSVERVSADQDGLEAWVTAFRAKALAAGITAEIYDRAMRGVTYDPAIVRRDRNQAEFTKTIWDYLETAVSPARIRNGQAALARQDAALTQIEAQYGVEKEILTAIWGLESAYGAVRGNTEILSAMATLAYDARRAAFFEAQVLAALRILQDGHTTQGNLRGSWAGAMGHTQFMPTSWQDHAVDFDGDGKRDIWSDDPRDALASAAAYLRANGWVTGQPWGVEVRLPGGFDYASARRETMRLPSAWARLGVRDVNGQPVPDHGRASILLPAGHTGAAFMIFDNFEVLESYNTADAYVIGVGHLADRIAGGPGLAGGWPTSDRALTFDERIELQERLTAAGFDTQKIDAKIGPLTINAVRRYQQATGRVPDGYASLGVLESLRR